MLLTNENGFVFKKRESFNIIGLFRRYRQVSSGVLEEKKIY